MSRPDFSDGSPYASTGDPYAPTRKSHKGCWIAVIILGVIGVMCCGGLAAIVSFGLKMTTVAVSDILRDNPQIQEHIGEIQTFEMDFTRSMQEEDEEIFHYRVTGNKGQGQISVRQTTDDDGNEVILSAELRMSDGTIVPIMLDEEEY